MPKYYPNNRFSDCWSSVGNITFYHRNGECYYKTKPNPTFPGTQGQMSQLSLHKRAIAAWRTLTHQIQLQWNTLAKNVKSKRPPYNTNTHISGYNLFVSAYHGLAATGKESVPEPLPISTFPQIHLEHQTSTIINDTVLQITFASDSPIDIFNTYTLIGKLQITKPGYRPNTGQYRNYHPTITTSEDKTMLTFTIPILQQQDISIISIHLKYFIVHTLSGYRTPEQYLTTTAPPK